MKASAKCINWNVSVVCPYSWPSQVLWGHFLPSSKRSSQYFLTIPSSQLERSKVSSDLSVFQGEILTTLVVAKSSGNGFVYLKHTTTPKRTGHTFQCQRRCGNKEACHRPLSFKGLGHTNRHIFRAWDTGSETEIKFSLPSLISTVFCFTICCTLCEICLFFFLPRALGNLWQQGYGLIHREFLL